MFVLFEFVCRKFCEILPGTFAIVKSARQFPALSFKRISKKIKMNAFIWVIHCRNFESQLNICHDFFLLVLLSRVAKVRVRELFWLDAVVATFMLQYE